jgi:hypothetical protein
MKTLFTGTEIGLRTKMRRKRRNHAVVVQDISSRGRGMYSLGKRQLVY